jgi:hypothetical protein
MSDRSNEIPLSIPTLGVCMAEVAPQRCPKIAALEAELAAAKARLLALDAIEACDQAERMTEAQKAALARWIEIEITPGAIEVAFQKWREKRGRPTE